MCVCVIQFGEIHFMKLQHLGNNKVAITGKCS